MYKVGIGIFLTIFFLTQGCVIIPVPEKCVSGDKVTKTELTSINPGITTKFEIVELLGNPDVLWLDENVFAYKWKMIWALMPWIVPAGYGVVGGCEEFTIDYVLLVQFDLNDRVVRFEQIKRPMFTSYGELLENWAQQDEETSSDNNAGKK